MKRAELKEFLDQKASIYNNPKFIESDPIQIPHLFSKKEDIEVSGFLTSTIAWGNRKSIINSGLKMMELMDQSPHDFVLNHSDVDLEKLPSFAHRTFNRTDFIYFIRALKNIYCNHGGLEMIFYQNSLASHLQESISHFKKVFFELLHDQRSEKHIGDPMKNSAAKRVNMFLRWMVRKDNNGVDFGIWNKISPASLSCPLDVHSGNVSRKLGLLHRKQNDSKAVTELDTSLRLLDPKDPVKYDFALFGLGVFEKF